MKPDVSILIVTYNSADEIARCLNSVFVAGRRLREEVVIVDNGSTDDTVAVVREQFPQVKLVVPGSNLGFAAGVNLAARHATADYFLLLNPDTELIGHAIDRVVQFAREYPHHGLYGGRTLKPDGSLEPSSCWGLPTLWSLTMFATGLSTLAPRNRWLDPESLGHWERDTVREVGIVTGCFLLVHRTVWEQLEGFDERYFMYGEDVDLAIRARAAGLRPVICPDAQLIHEIGRSSATPAAKMLLLFRGKASVIRTHWQGNRRRAGLALLVAGVGLRAFLSALSARLRGRPSSRRWETVWQQRRTWLQGYPERKSSGGNGLRPAFGY